MCPKSAQDVDPLFTLARRMVERVPPELIGIVLAMALLMPVKDFKRTLLILYRPRDFKSSSM